MMKIPAIQKKSQPQFSSSKFPSLSPPKFSLAASPMQLQKAKAGKGKKTTAPQSAPLKGAKGTTANDNLDPFFNPENLETLQTLPTKKIVQTLIGMQEGDALDQLFQGEAVYNTELEAGNLSEFLTIVEMLQESIEKPGIRKHLMEEDSAMTNFALARKKESIKRYEIVKQRLANYLILYRHIEAEKLKKVEEGGDIYNLSFDNAKEALAQKVVGVAMSQVGKVQGNLRDNDGDRRGYNHIMEYFAVSNEEKSYLNEDSKNGKEVKRILPGEKFHHRDENGKPVYKATNDVLPEWCFMFALWAFRSAGLKTEKFSTKLNRGFSQTTGFKEVKKGDVRPGDVAQIAAAQHQFIIAGLLGKSGDRDRKLLTIEGNTNAKGSGIGGEVAFHNGKRSLNGCTGFWRHESLK